MPRAPGALHCGEMLLALTTQPVELAVGAPGAAGFAEPNATAVLLVVAGVMLAVSVLLTRTVDRLGVPVVLLFLVLGMLGGSDGIGGVWFDDYGMAFRVGTVALILILFDGGLNTPWRAVRGAFGPAGTLATLGVLLTAGLVAAFARLLGMGWPEALLVGAVVSSTDAAAVFAVLRGGRLSLKPRLGNTIEVESCINDPMAVILTTAVVQWILAPTGSSLWTLAWAVPLQLVMGAAVGVLVGFAGAALLRKARVTTIGLFPVLTLGLALLSFGVATLAYGSGFLAVYVTAVVLGESRLPYKVGLARIHDAMAWLAQTTLFLMLGLLVFPSQLPAVAWTGVAIALFLAFVARPLAVAACLWPFKFPRREVAYVGWAGLRGAVPIVLATIPVMEGVEGSERIFNLVFFVVVISSLVPGATIRWATRRMGLDSPQPAPPSAMLEVHASHRLNGEIVPYHVSESLAVCGAKLSEITFPEGASVVMIVRGEQLVPAKGSTVLMPGDHAYVFCRQEDRPLIELLFGGPEH